MFPCFITDIIFLQKLLTSVGPCIRPQVARVKYGRVLCITDDTREYAEERGGREEIALLLHEMHLLLLFNRARHQKERQGF